MFGCHSVGRISCTVVNNLAGSVPFRRNPIRRNANPNHKP